MTQLLVESLAMFTDACNESQLRTLDATVSAIEPAACGPREIRAMLALLERFPDEDGFGVFWSILHCLEKCLGYASLAVESAARAPTEFNLIMINRLLNSGVTSVDGQSLLSVLEAAISSNEASINTKEVARNFVDHQHGIGKANS